MSGSPTFASDAGLATETLLQGSVQPDCSAYVPYKLNAITVPTKEEIPAPTAESKIVAVMRFELDTSGKLKKRTQAETAKPTTSGKTKTTRSESVQNACDSTLLR